MRRTHPPCTPFDSTELHGRLDRYDGYPVMVILDRQCCPVTRWRSRYDQGPEQRFSDDHWEYVELELADSRRVLVGRDLVREQRWRLLGVLDPGVRLVGHKGEQHHGAWHDQPGIPRRDEGEPMADTRTTTPYHELAEHVAGLDLIAHTWTVDRILADQPADEPEEAEHVATWVRQVRDFLTEVDEVLAERHRRANR